jgi:hypothetical protein
MTKRKKLAKEALKNPELFSQGELAYMQLWLNERKRLKSEKKQHEVYGHDAELK